MSQVLTLKDAQHRDVQDRFNKYRERFYTSEENMVYLDGNSLGRLPEATRSLLKDQVDLAWGSQLIRSWNVSWMDLPNRLSAKLAPLIGADPSDVLFCDATSVNLYKLAHAALIAQAPRLEIVSDSLNFPSDLYVLQGVLDQFPGESKLRIAQSPNDIDVHPDQIKELLTPDTAVLSLSLVTYKSAYLHPLKELTEAAHDVGALVLWDLSHAAGAVEVDLQAAGVDLAVGCSYKYLNGGPGAPAFLYVSKDLQSRLESPIKGWFGDARPFDFDANYQAAAGIQRFGVGTPPVLSLAAIEPGLDLLLETGMSGLRQKSLALQDYLLELCAARLFGRGFELGSPQDPAQRGSHISLRHKYAGMICQALIEPPPGQPCVIPDFRAPRSIRLGIAPLYTSCEDIWIAVDRLVQIHDTQEYLHFDTRPQGVT